MNEIINWLKDPNRNYTEGRILYDNYVSKVKFSSYFAKNQNAKQGSEPYRILVTKLQNFIRARKGKTINVDYKAEKQRAEAEVKELITPKDVPDIPDKLEMREGYDLPLTKTKKLINKLLTYHYCELSEREKELFNDEGDFINKANLLIRNSDITREMRAKHEKMKISQDKEERALLRFEIATLDKERFKNFQIIDNRHIGSGEQIVEGNIADIRLKMNNARANRTKYLKKMKKEKEGTELYEKYKLKHDEFDQRIKDYEDKLKAIQ